jgi:hypothetical protein
MSKQITLNLRVTQEKSSRLFQFSVIFNFWMGNELPVVSFLSVQKLYKWRIVASSLAHL